MIPINELSVGDWVLETEFDRNRPARIDAVVDKTRVLLETCALFTPSCYIEPIPITAAILEKNGFIIKEKWAQIGNFGDSPLIMWHFVDDPILGDYNTELEVHQNDTGKVHVHIPCKYVHELQHALRLCHINKEITL